MYKKRKRTKNDASIDTEKIKEQIKQELVVEMQSNRASSSPATLKSSCPSVDNVGLVDCTAELATKVRCDDRTHEDLIGMLNDPTHGGLWITWRGFQCEAAIGLVH
jgi:hypothetical protein